MQKGQRLQDSFFPQVFCLFSLLALLSTRLTQKSEENLISGEPRQHKLWTQEGYRRRFVVHTRMGAQTKTKKRDRFMNI